MQSLGGGVSRYTGEAGTISKLHLAQLRLNTLLRKVRSSSVAGKSNWLVACEAGAARQSGGLGAVENQGIGRSNQLGCGRCRCDSTQYREECATG